MSDQQSEPLSPAPPTEEQRVQAIWTALRNMSAETIRTSLTLSQRTRNVKWDAITGQTERECQAIYDYWKRTRPRAGRDDWRVFYRAILLRALEIIDLT